MILKGFGEMMETEPKDLKEAPPQPCTIQVHQFTSRLSDNVTACYQVLKLQDSVFIWIGPEDKARFDDLSVAMRNSRPSKDGSHLSCHIMGGGGGGGGDPDVSTFMATRLSKRLNKQVFLSYNFSSNDVILLQKVEEKLVEEIVANPSKF